MKTSIAIAEVRKNGKTTEIARTRGDRPGMSDPLRKLLPLALATLVLELENEDITNPDEFVIRILRPVAE